MAYCTQADLIARFGAEITELLDKDNSGSEDTNALASAISDADALIDSYIGGRYTVPLSAPIPALINAISCDVTRYKLWGNRAPEHVRQRYDDAVKSLTDIAKAVASLPLTDSAAATGAFGVSYDEPDRLFTMSNLSDF